MFQKDTLELSETERRAANLAGAFRKFIQHMKEINHSTDLDLLLDQFIPLRNNAVSLLHILGNMCEKEEIPEITNLYYQDFLLQVSRFNQFFHETQIIHLKDNKNITTYPPCTNAFESLQTKLQDNGIAGIHHALLKQYSDVQLTVTITQEDIFRDVVDDKGHYFYSAHTDFEGFKNAHKTLDWQTGVSSAYSFFTNPSMGEAQEHWFKPADRERHEQELQARRKALLHIREGKALSLPEQKQLQEGLYYSYQSPVKFGLHESLHSNIQITHGGHGSEFIAFHNSAIPLFICINPVNDDPGKGLISFFKSRNMDPAFPVDQYPATNIVLLTDYNPKHLSEHTLKEAFGTSSILFVVPQGCGTLLRSFGMENIHIIELATWNAVLNIRLCDKFGNASYYMIRSFPANHMSSRPGKEACTAMSTGYLIEDLSTNQAILYSSNTAFLDDIHIFQLLDYCRKKELHILAACIPLGPDRPRNLLKDRHQSTPEALIMQAYLSRINAFSCKAKMNVKGFSKNICYVWGNNQGCFDHALTSFHDVDNTLIRLLALLRILGDKPIKDINEDILNKYLLYYFMDSFEQEGLKNLLQVYVSFNLDLSARQVCHIIYQHIHIPTPGFRADFSNGIPFKGFLLDYERLLQNRAPLLKNYNKEDPKACEYFLLYLDPDLYQSEVKKKSLVCELFNLYLRRPKQNYLVEDKTALIKTFLEKVHGHMDFEVELGKLYLQLFKKSDDCRRNEGHAQTVFILLAGIFHFPEFRRKIYLRHQELRSGIFTGLEMIHETEMVDTSNPNCS